MDQKTIPFSELAKHAKKVAIKSKQQVMNGKPGYNKRSWGKWNQYPEDYSGKINDPKYPTAFVCDYISEIDLYLGIIDLDKPKEKEDIPLNVLKSKAGKIIDNTYSVQTASGGYHIYLLSKKKPGSKQPKLNIDYQANTGEGNGKYIITDYRWNAETGEKDHYTRLPESPKSVRIVDSIDDIFNAFISDLEDSGYIKTAQNELKTSIISLLKPELKEGSREKFACALTGYLRKQGFNKKTVRKVLKGVFEDDPEFSKRMLNINRTYELDINKIIGMAWLEKNLPPVVIDELKRLTENGSSNLKQRIASKLMKHKEPHHKEIADLLNIEHDFYINPQTQIYYEKLEDGRFHQIDYITIVDYCNEIFGPNQISTNVCKNVLPNITNKITKDYNLLEFSNGILNTKTKEFNNNKTQLKAIPKLVMPFKWNPDAKGGYIKEVFEQILDYSNNPENMELWLRVIGHAFMGVNSIEKFMIVVGPSRSGKSTLSTALERIFNTSHVPTQKMVKNDRFALIEMIDKDLNIDDDIGNGIIRGIGTFNSIIAGKPIQIELKGSNDILVLKNEEIPICIANGNSLPPIIGEGFNTRLVLIKAPHACPIEGRDHTLHSRINQGEHDSELEWLVYTVINQFWDNIDKVMITQSMEDNMNREYEFKSYPLKAAIEELFEDDWDEENTISVKEVNKYLKIWSKVKYKQGKISKEHKKPSNSQIKKAMDHAGYDQKNEHYMEDDTRTTQRVYIDIKTTPEVLNIIGELKGISSGIDLSTKQKIGCSV